MAGWHIFFLGRVKYWTELLRWKTWMPSVKRLGLIVVWSSTTNNLCFILKGLTSLNCPFGWHKISTHQLLLFLSRWLTIILEFLNLPWEDAVMHHEEQINKPGGVSFSIIFVQFSLKVKLIKSVTFGFGIKYFSLTAGFYMSEEPPKQFSALLLSYFNLMFETSLKQFSYKVRVSMVERSSDQIIKPVNLDALTTWVGTYPEVSVFTNLGIFAIEWLITHFPRILWTRWTKSRQCSPRWATILTPTRQTTEYLMALSPTILKRSGLLFSQIIR